MSSLFKGFGAALDNQANEIMQVGDALGPVTLVVVNTGAYPVAIQASKLSDDALVATDDETAVADEDTGYDGDTSTVAFTGQALNNYPITPGSVTITPITGGDTVNAVDSDGDGLLYTDDEDGDLCGSIDYFDGSLVLNYPAGKAPNTGNITADYTYQSGTVAANGGVKTFRVGSNPPAETIVIKAAAQGGTSQVKIDALISF